MKREKRKRKKRTKTKPTSHTIQAHLLRRDCDFMTGHIGDEECVGCKTLRFKHPHYPFYDRDEHALWHRPIIIRSRYTPTSIVRDGKRWKLGNAHLFALYPYYILPYDEKLH